MPTKPKKPQPQTPNEVQTKDFFETPRCAVDILLPFIPKGTNDIWEIAAGNGKISNYLIEKGYSVLCTDINGNYEYCNFLESNRKLSEYWAIISNPPFSLKKNFYEKCMQYVDRYGISWALLIPLDYSKWLIDAIRYNHCEKIIPDSRINYITPSGKSGKDSSAQFHSGWLTHGLNLGQSETFVHLSKEDKGNV